MFKEIKSGIIESSQGFVVNDHDLGDLKYIEGDRVAKFFVEPGVGGYIYYLDGPVAWESPFEKEPITPERQEQIKDRIVAAVKFRGYPVIIQR